MATERTKSTSRAPIWGRPELLHCRCVSPGISEQTRESTTLSAGLPFLVMLCLPPWEALLRFPATPSLALEAAFQLPHSMPYIPTCLSNGRPKTCLKSYFLRLTTPKSCLYHSPVEFNQTIMAPLHRNIFFSIYWLPFS